jgi:hypothetical protein
VVIAEAAAVENFRLLADEAAESGARIVSD